MLYNSPASLPHLMFICAGSHAHVLFTVRDGPSPLTARAGGTSGGAGDGRGSPFPAPPLLDYQKFNNEVCWLVGEKGGGGCTCESGCKGVVKWQKGEMHERLLCLIHIPLTPPALPVDAMFSCTRRHGPFALPWSTTRRRGWSATRTSSPAAHGLRRHPRSVERSF